MACARRDLTINCSVALMLLLTFQGCLVQSKPVSSPAAGAPKPISDNLPILGERPVPAPAPSPHVAPAPAGPPVVSPASPPRPAVVPPKPAPIPVPPFPPAPAPSHPDSCDGGCVAGAVIGSLAGAAILGALAFFAWGMWGPTGHEGSIYLPPAKDLEAGNGHPGKPITPAPIQTTATPNSGTSAVPAKDSAAGALWPGQVVCCRTGPHSCQTGSVISSATGTMIQVKMGGEARSLRVQDVVPLFQRNEKVYYTDPVDGKRRVATVVDAEGDHWPPSYQVKFANESGLVDTVQKQLKPFRGSQV